jgi:hypothetical protein
MNDRRIPPNQPSDEYLDELRQIRREQAELRRRLDEFFGVFLNAKYPYGRPTDRWRRGA